MIKIKQLSHNIRRVTCPNPSKFTFKGTNCFIIGRQRLTLIDPGPIIKGFIPQLVEALKGEQINHILITHTHKDHSPAAAELASLTGAKTYGAGKHQTYRQDIANPFLNSADWDFIPDQPLVDHEIFQCDQLTFKAIKTDGHCFNHLGYGLSHIDNIATQGADNALFIGDHIMGWASTIVAPPDGNMAAYMQNLYKLKHSQYAIFYSAHGAAINNPKARVEALIQHRLNREAEIIKCLENGIHYIKDMVGYNYPKLDKALMGPAALSVLSQLEWLMDKNLVTSKGGLKMDSCYKLV